MQVASRGTVGMSGMTEATVRALPAYLAYFDITRAKKDWVVAFEQLDASHTYDIAGLERTTKQIIDEHDSGSPFRLTLSYFRLQRIYSAAGWTELKKLKTCKRV